MRQGRGQLIDQRGKKGMPKGRHQQTDTEGLVCLQTAGVVVDAVIQFFSGGFHPFTVFLTDRIAVEDA